jgi:hypothetical protein
MSEAYGHPTNGHQTNAAPVTPRHRPTTAALNALAAAYGLHLVLPDGPNSIVDLYGQPADIAIPLVQDIAAGLGDLEVTGHNTGIRTYSGWLVSRRVSVRMSTAIPAPVLPGHACRGCGLHDCPDRDACERGWRSADATGLLTATQLFACPACRGDVRYSSPCAVMFGVAARRRHADAVLVGGSR